MEGLVHFESVDANKPYFVEKWLNSTPEIKLGGHLFDFGRALDYPVLILAGISLSTVALVGAMMYNNYRRDERSRSSEAY